MKSRYLVGLALACVAVAAPLGVADGKTQKQKPVVLQITARDGAEVLLGPFEDGVARAYCPSGYLATGGGALNGAIDLAYSVPTTSGRGWEAGGLNTSLENPYDFSVEVICAKGSNKNLRVRAAALGASEKLDAMADLRSKLGRR